jgi:amino acid transporter
MLNALFIDLVIVFAFALAIGTIVRYVIPGRLKHGLLLVPAFAVVFAVLIWEIAVWSGMPTEWNQLAWLILFLLTAGATVAFTILLTRRRSAQDDAALAASLAGIRAL